MPPCWRSGLDDSHQALVFRKEKCFGLGEDPVTKSNPALGTFQQPTVKKGGVSQAVESSQEDSRTPGMGPDLEEMAPAACGS